MRKRKSPRETIENPRDFKQEQAYIKFPGQELIPVGLERDNEGVKIDSEEIKRLSKKLPRKRRKKPYTLVHTHPHDYSREGRYQELIEDFAMPSREDIKKFLTDDDIGTMVIAPQNYDTGEIGGYFILRKTKRTKPFGWRGRASYFSKHLTLHNLLTRMIELRPSLMDENDERRIREIANKYSLQYRFIRADEKGNVKEPEHPRTLERAVTAGIIFVFIGSILLLSQNLTGFAIYNLNDKNPGKLILIILAIISAITLIKRLK